MKIAVFSSMYPNSKIYKSGIFVHEQVKALKLLGLNIVVVAPVPLSNWFFALFSKKWKLYSEIPEFEEIDGVEVFHPRFIALPNGLLKQYWGYYYAYSINKLFSSNKLYRIHLIHAHGSLPDNHGAYLVAAKNKLPYILTVHGSSVYAGPRRKWQFEKISEAIKNASAVIGVSSIVNKKIETLIGRKNSYLVHNGFSKSENNCLDKKNKSITLLFGATLIERKGCEILLKALAIVLKKIPDVKLNIAGGGILLEKMKDLAKTLNIENNAKFFGVVSHKTMLNLMTECDVFVLPSWDEAFGVVYLEAMINKKPIIGTLGEGVSDIVVDSENGFLVKAKDISGLAEKIELLVNDNSLRETMGTKGYLTAQNMTWESNAILTSKVYKKVLGK